MLLTQIMKILILTIQRLKISIHLGTLEQANNIADKFIKSDKKRKNFYS